MFRVPGPQPERHVEDDQQLLVDGDAGEGEDEDGYVPVGDEDEDGGVGVVDVAKLPALPSRAGTCQAQS